MSAYRIPGPDGRIVLVPADDGMTPYRHGSYVGGSLVQERRPMALPVPATTAATRARNAGYKASRKAQALGLCGRIIPSGVCARTSGHGYSCRTRDWLDRRSAAYRAKYVPGSRAGEGARR